MGLIQWATSPWGREVPIHIAFGLVWVAIVCGALFLIAHAIYVAYWAKSSEAASGATVGASRQLVAGIPERVPRHSFGARLFHGVMALAMLALLFTAFLPKMGVRFAWVRGTGSLASCLPFRSSITCSTRPSGWTSGRFGPIAKIWKTLRGEFGARWEWLLLHPGNLPNTRWKTSSI